MYDDETRWVVSCEIMFIFLKLVYFFVVKFVS